MKKYIVVIFMVTSIYPMQEKQKQKMPELQTEPPHQKKDKSLTSSFKMTKKKRCKMCAIIACTCLCYPCCKKCLRQNQGSNR